MGIKVHQVPLPNIPEVSSNEIVIQPSPVQNPILANNPDLLKKIDFEKQPQNRIVVKTELRNPHPLVQQVKKLLSNSKPYLYGRLSTSRMSSCIDVQVSEKTLDRALRIIDALICALESRGYKVSSNSDHQYRTMIKIAKENVHVRIIEKADRIENPQHKIYSFSSLWEYTPSGKLQFEIAPYWSEGCQKRWCDSPKAQLENQLNDIVVGIIICAEAQRRRREERVEAAQKENENRLARELLEKQKQDELNRFKQLESQAEAWQKSQNLRAFIKACEAKFIELSGPIQPDSHEAKWLQWANSYADSLDPLKKDIKL
jgi:hypothetical protein